MASTTASTVPSAYKKASVLVLILLLLGSFVLTAFHYLNVLDDVLLHRGMATIVATWCVLCFVYASIYIYLNQPKRVEHLLLKIAVLVLVVGGVSLAVLRRTGVIDNQVYYYSVALITGFLLLALGGIFFKSGFRGILPEKRCSNASRVQSVGLTLTIVTMIVAVTLRFVDDLTGSDTMSDELFEYMMEGGTILGFLLLIGTHAYLEESGCVAKDE